MHGHKDIVEMLLDRGADINMADNYGFTPLHEAAIHSQVEVVQFLIERGAKFDTTVTGHWSGKTPLHQAGINKPDTDGFTPLHEAAIRGRPARGGAVPH